MRVASDIGGTFTDLVSLDERTGRLGSAKVDTTPPEFERGVIDALRRVSITPRSNSGGVVSTFAEPSLPVRSSKETRSVNVPPMSLATRIALLLRARLPQGVVELLFALSYGTPADVSISRSLARDSAVSGPAGRRTAAWGIRSSITIASLTTTKNGASS